MNRYLKNLVQICIGATLFALGFSLFLQPHNIAPGGFSGIAVILNYITDIPSGTIIWVLNIPTIVYAAKKLGRYFILTTLFSVSLSSVLVNLFAHFEITTEPLLAAVYGGILLGTGLGIIFKIGSSTGGTDIITRLIRLSKPHLSLGQIMILLDIFIIVSSIIVFQDINTGLYSLITVYICSRVIDNVIEGADLAKMVYVVSDENAEIAKVIARDITRGSTLLHGTGTYTNTDRNVLMCALKRHQIPEIKNIIEEIDPNAFMIITDVREVLGFGFKNRGDSYGL